MFKMCSLLFCSVLTWAQNPLDGKIVGAIPTAHRTTLTQALAEIGLRVQNGFTSFGVVFAAPEPVVDVYLPEATSLDNAVQRVISQVPGYTYEAVSAHLIDVYPSSIRSDPNNPLNLRVADVRLAGVTAMDLFANPARYIPELKTRQDKDKPPQACGGLGPGLGSESSAGIELDLHNVTIKQILDAAAVADSSLRQLAARTHPPAGWVLRWDTDPATGKQNNEWSFMVTVPRDWRSLLSR